MMILTKRFQAPFTRERYRDRQTHTQRHPARDTQTRREREEEGDGERCKSLGHVLLFGPTPTHDSLSFYSVEKHILSNFNAVIVMPRLAEQPPDFNRLISSMRRRCQACVKLSMLVVVIPDTETCESDF